MKCRPFFVCATLLLAIVSCKAGNKIVHVEGRGRNGLPEHFFSYYLNERGEKVYDGKETYWWSGSFRKRLEFNWKDGRRNGIFKHWYSNGNTEREEFFVNDTLDSIIADFYENGLRKTEAHLKNKKAHGLERHWDSTGQLNELTTFKDGHQEGLHIIWFPNGQKRQEDSTNSQGDGVLRIWNINGQLTEESSLVHGHPEGPQAYWFANGRLERKLTLLKNWRHEGTDSIWYETGELEYSGFWKNNQMDGYRVHWDKNGNKLEETKVVAGKADTEYFGKASPK